MEPPSLPWYRFGIVWWVWAPPVLSVIAGMFALFLILTHPDADVRTPHPRAPVVYGQAHNSLVPPND
jgi:hypothetical protein